MSRGDSLSSTSKFYSPKTEYVDSIQSTPEGMAKLNEIAKSAMTSGKMENIPRPDGTMYVTKSLTDGKVWNYELVGMNRLYSVDDKSGFSLTMINGDTPQ